MYCLAKVERADNVGSSWNLTHSLTFKIFINASLNRNAFHIHNGRVCCGGGGGVWVGGHGECIPLNALPGVLRILRMSLDSLRLILIRIVLRRSRKRFPTHFEKMDINMLMKTQNLLAFCEICKHDLRGNTLHGQMG